MSTLTLEPLRTAKSMTSGHEVVETALTDERHQPFAYLYSDWDVEPIDAEPGHYDAGTQTWVLPPDVPMAGVITRTTTRCRSLDTCTDDVCS